MTLASPLMMSLLSTGSENYIKFVRTSTMANGKHLPALEMITVRQDAARTSRNSQRQPAKYLGEGGIERGPRFMFAATAATAATSAVGATAATAATAAVGAASASLQIAERARDTGRFSANVMIDNSVAEADIHVAYNDVNTNDCQQQPATRKDRPFRRPDNRRENLPTAPRRSFLAVAAFPARR